MNATDKKLQSVAADFKLYIEAFRAQPRHGTEHGLRDAFYAGGLSLLTNMLILSDDDSITPLGAHAYFDAWRLEYSEFIKDAELRLENDYLEYLRSTGGKFLRELEAGIRAEGPEQ